MDTDKVNVGDVKYHTRKLRLYRCSNCANEQNKKCLAKPSKADIRLNKKRNHCKEFKLDEQKYLKNKRKFKPIPIEQRPDWYWLTKKQRKRLAELLQGAMVTPPATAQSDIIAPPHANKLIWTPEDEDKGYGD